MHYNSIEALSEALYSRVSADKVIILYATNNIIVTGYYTNDRLVDSVVVLNEKEGWEIVEGEKSKKTAHLYLAYFGNVIDLIGDKVETDSLFNTDLLN